MEKIYLTLFLLTCLLCDKTFSQCTTPTTVPYHESFNSITALNQLPTCMAISDPSTCVTYTSGGYLGQTCAGFIDVPGQTSYFYTRAMQLNTGITYSVSSWYKVPWTTSATWTDFSILLGTSQGSTGLVTLASTNGVASNSIYSPVSNTFVVPSSGVYYFAVSGTSSGGSGSTALTWDDLDVKIACGISSNQPTLTVVSSSSILCMGQTNFTATASGADTYLWFDGTTGPILTNPIAPQFGPISVEGTNTLTACSSTIALYLTISPTPQLYVTAFKPSICVGENVQLTATGASSYSWSTQATSPVITLTPGSSTTYTVVGTSASGCTATAEYFVMVKPLPVIGYTTSLTTPTICMGETVTINANGAGSYKWTTTNSQIGFGDTYKVKLNITTTVTVEGTAPDGCVGKASFVVNVDECTGIKKNLLSGFKIYPNPGNGVYTLESGNTQLKSFVITDLSGRIVLTGETTHENLKVDLEKFSAGLYYANINCSGEKFSVKLIKE